MDQSVIHGYDHCGGTTLDDEETEHWYFLLQPWHKTTFLCK